MGSQETASLRMQQEMPRATHSCFLPGCRGVDHPVPVRAASERLHAGRRAIHQTAFDRDHPPPLVALDDWGEADLAPRTDPNAATIAGTGHPWASTVTTITTVSAEVRSREKTVPVVALKVV